MEPTYVHSIYIHVVILAAEVRRCLRDQLSLAQAAMMSHKQTIQSSSNDKKGACLCSPCFQNSTIDIALFTAE